MKRGVFQVLRHIAARMCAAGGLRYSVAAGRQLVGIAQKQGLAGAVRFVCYRLVEMHYEFQLGINTAGRVELSELGIADDEGGKYLPSNYYGLRKVLKSLHVRRERDVFLDMGSGKGRTVVMAATYPFRKVIGVNFSAGLNAIAQDNVCRARPHLLCTDIEFVTANAAAYRIPSEVTVIYFYNPFVGNTLARVFSNIRESVIESPRELTIVFKNPRHLLGEVGATPWLTKCREYPTLYGYPYVVYNVRCPLVLD